MPPETISNDAPVPINAPKEKGGANGGLKKSKSVIEAEVCGESWYTEGLAIVVIGASGDLAKRKTYPSLFSLYLSKLLPSNTVIWGYARSKLSHEDLRTKIKPFLLKTNKQNESNEELVDRFLSFCFYQSGSNYGDVQAYASMMDHIVTHESSIQHEHQIHKHNRLFYFAIPPNVFGDAGVAVKSVAMAPSGWSRIVVEKPFGRDTDSCQELSQVLAEQFDESHLYRIDHYLGKEMVQNLLIFRFGNSMFEWVWNRNAIKAVVISFKEPFGTDGRGGYFDQFGIIRDVVQNHLLQVLTLLAMEPPIEVDGEQAGDLIRDAKVQVLKAIPPIPPNDCLVGQYNGYTDDPTITNKDTCTATYAALRCFVRTPRWAGVPFILQAGKALDERLCDVRIQFRDAPAADSMFVSKCPPNELVLRLQPEEAIYMKANVKSPGFSTVPVQSALEMNYHTARFVAPEESVTPEQQQQHGQTDMPDAYTRLILDVLRARQAAFVRDDELKRSWEIFTPLLHHLERNGVKPWGYEMGSKGPEKAEEFMASKCEAVGGRVGPGSAPLMDLLGQSAL